MYHRAVHLVNMAEIIPATVRAVVASPDLGRPQITSIPFGSSGAVQHLAPQHVAVLNHAIGLNP